MIEGNFIVLEGVDGSGTTTQSDRLAKRLNERGLPVHVTREPSDGPIGTLIRQALTGRIVVLVDASHRLFRLIGLLPPNRRRNVQRMLVL